MITAIKPKLHPHNINTELCKVCSDDIQPGDGTPVGRRWSHIWCHYKAII